MCGASSQQLQIEQEQADQYTQMNDLMKQEYGQQQAIYGPMSQQLQSIFAKGPSQEGMSQEEKQNLNAQTVEGTAENYSAASKAVGEKMAAEGGSGVLPTGASELVKGNIASSAAQEQSREESQVEAEDYSLGRQNYQQSASGLMGIAAGENPLGWAGASTSAGSAASSTADQIAQEQNSWVNAAIGAVGAVGSGWATGGFKVNGGKK